MARTDRADLTALRVGQTDVYKRQALDLAQLRFKSQVGTLLEVTNAEANLAASEANLNSAVYQQQTAYATLLRAEGRR